MSWKILGLTMLLDVIVGCLAKYRTALRVKLSKQGAKPSARWELFPWKFKDPNLDADKGEVIPPKVRVPRSRVK
jgi:hypothetical protein